MIIELSEVNVMKKLIIVCEEKCRQYGDYLAQLISLEDDTEDETEIGRAHV